MKEIIKELYGIDIKTFIKISDNVYKIKTNDMDYSLKYIEQNNLDNIIDKLILLKIDFFVYPLKNIKNNYVSNFEGVNFIVLPWIEDEGLQVNDLKLNFFLSSIAELHNKSFYTLKANSIFFDQTYDFIANKIDDVNDKIEKYMSKIERLDYKSPSQWLFLLNYPLYINSINKANESLEQFKDLCDKKDSVRISLTYNDFDYKHILLKEGKLLGIENVELTSPIYDVFYTFSSLNEMSMDIKMYYEKYFNRFILDEYEKKWLLSLLYIPKIEDFTNDEEKDIKNVTHSLNYMRNSEDIVKFIKNESFIEKNNDK